MPANGANRHTSNSETAVIVQGTYFHPPVSPDQVLILKIANNSVNSAGIQIDLIYSASSG